MTRAREGVCRGRLWCGQFCGWYMGLWRVFFADYDGDLEFSRGCDGARGVDRSH